jgi:hypothetical protein
MNFQSESKRSGDEFEDLVLLDLKSRGFIQIDKNISIPGTGCEVDFLAHKYYRPCSYAPEMSIIEYVESKGGKAEKGKRPGAQRTDNVKKAIANGALIKAKYPEAYFVVYFSAKPFTNSSSADMIDTALCHKIIDEVRYITDRESHNNQLDLFSNPESEAEK